jgi:hypothetical protein
VYRTVARPSGSYRPSLRSAPIGMVSRRRSFAPQPRPLHEVPLLGPRDVSDACSCLTPVAPALAQTAQHNSDVRG